jgi:hypothetical protein
MMTVSLIDMLAAATTFANSLSMASLKNNESGTYFIRVHRQQVLQIAA